MIATPINNYKLFPKLHPLSLLTQLDNRRVTGCLSISNETVSWSIYLDAGKLIYASYSHKLFERIESHLQQLVPEFAQSQITNAPMWLIWQKKSENQSILPSDYQAICWLVNQKYITHPQAGILIEELAKEVLESFLCLKQGSYQFYPEYFLPESPKFCQLDLRSIVAYCQKQLRHQSNSNSTVLFEMGADKKITQKTGGIDPEQNHKSINTEISKGLYKIACIDDSQTVLNSISYFLHESEFSVVVINDPVRALMQVIRSKPDLILLDIEMPNLDGYELCSLLRRHSAFKNTPIIMVTGRTGFLDKAKAKIVRSSGYLTKPFTRSDLLRTISQYI